MSNLQLKMDKKNIINLCDSSDEKQQTICRLCSMTFNDLLDLFAPNNVNLSMRILILLATGIEIKENDIVSRKVCHRCCEICIKLHKYRTNSVANDKLLKEQNGLPYAPPITDQKELLRVASKIAIGQNGVSNTTRSNLDALEVLNLSFKRDVDTDNKPSIPKNHFSLNKRKFGSKLTYKHRSIRALCKTYKNIILPVEVLKSDISPVISLDRSEITDWYTEQIAALKTKLKGITFKEIPRVSNNTSPSSSHIVVPSATREEPLILNKITPASRTVLSNGKIRKVREAKPNTVNQPKDNKGINVENSLPTKRTVKRIYSQIIDNSDDDSDDIGREEFQSNYERDDDYPPPNVTKNVNRMSEVTTIPKIQQNLADNLLSVSSNNSTRPHKHPSARKRTGRPMKGKQVSTQEDNANKTEKSTVKESSEIPLKITKARNSTEIPFKISTGRDSPGIPLKIVKGNDGTELTIASSTTLLLQKELSCTETLPELIKGKSLAIFMCSMCNKLYDTKKELSDHVKTHLSCKFCKKRLRSLSLLNKHQNESCYINIVKNQPHIKLKKVDTIWSIMNQYPKAFQDSNDETTPSEESNSDYNNETRPAIEEVVLSMPAVNTYLENEETKTDPRDMQAVCISISDDSSDEVECVENLKISRQKILNNSFTDKTTPLKESQNSTVDLTENNASGKPDNEQPNAAGSGPGSVLKEKEMIRSLFKKHSYPLEQCAMETQTFVVSNNNIKYTKTNLIILDSMFPELSCYKIPIHLESQPKISARFKENCVIPETTGSLECWAFKKTIDVVQKQAIVRANPTPSNNSLVLLNTNASTASPKTITSFHIPEMFLKQPKGLEGLPPSVIMTVPNANANTIPFTLSSTSGTNFFTSAQTPAILSLENFANKNPQSNNIVQLLESSNTIQYQAPIVPQSSASLVFGMNQNQQAGHQAQPNNVLHFNNNVTNVNKFYVLAGQPMPTRLSNVNYGSSYLNNLLPSEPTAQLREIESGNQNSNPNSVVVCNVDSNELVHPNNNNRLRVKNISELN